MREKSFNLSPDYIFNVYKSESSTPTYPVIFMKIEGVCVGSHWKTTLPAPVLEGRGSNFHTRVSFQNLPLLLYTTSVCFKLFYYLIVHNYNKNEKYLSKTIYYPKAVRGMIIYSHAYKYLKNKLKYNTNNFEKKFDTTDILDNILNIHYKGISQNYGIL